MKTLLNADFCVIGAGSGGLSFAAGASQMGASVILLESHKMGGDCLNTGCVPSKALIRSAKVLNYIRRAKEFGFAQALLLPSKPLGMLKTNLFSNHC